MGQNTQPGQSKGDFSGLNGDTLAQAILSLKAPITQRPNGGYSHKGYTAWDYGIPENTPLKAESDIQTEYIPNQGIYGNRILVTMPDGKKYYVSHLSKGKSGKYGAGQVYGYSGNTGKSSGPHVEIAPQ